MTVHEPRVAGVPTMEECTVTMGYVQAFLHGELPEATADAIRAHLLACEHCLEHYDIEALIAELIKRSCKPSEASDDLRDRVSCMHVELPGM